MEAGRLEFLVDANDQFGGQPLCVYVGTPAVLDTHPGCWACLAGWTGPAARERPAFGASPFQAVALAFPMLEALLGLHFPDAEFLVDGRPLFIKLTGE